MFSFLSRKKKKSPLDSATVPAGQRVYAIGDVHGCIDPLRDLLGQIDADNAARGPAQTTILFLGDLVDRGPDSSGVVQLLLDRAQRDGNLRFLMGNHEETMLNTVDDPSEKIARFFYRIGGRETILSYGMPVEELDAIELEDLAARLPGYFPKAHIDFIAGFENLVTIGDYAFVHAGILPGIPLAEQKLSDLRWIRDEFVRSRETHEKVIVYGHTIHEEVREGISQIGIDTGAWRTGVLTALGLEGAEHWYLQTPPIPEESGA